MPPSSLCPVPQTPPVSFGQAEAHISSPNANAAGVIFAPLGNMVQVNATCNVTGNYAQVGDW